MRPDINKFVGPDDEIESQGFVGPDEAIDDTPIKKKVPTTSGSKSGGQDSKSGSELVQVGEVSDAEVSGIQAFLKTDKALEDRPGFEAPNTKIAVNNQIGIKPDSGIPTFADEPIREPQTDLFNDAIQRGLNQGEMANLLNINNGELTEADFAEMARLNRQNGRLVTSPAFSQLEQAEGFNKFAVLASNPELIGEVLLTSMSAQVRHGLARAGAGAVAGAPLGPGGVGAGVIAGMGVSSLNLEYSGKIMETLTEMGVDITDAKQLEQAFTDPEKIDKAKELGLKRGIPIAVFDVLTAGVSGKVASIPAKTLLKKAGKGAAAMAVESTGGMAGELSGQVAAGEDINTTNILLEGVAEIGTAPVDVAMGAIAMRKRQGADVKTDVARTVGSLPPDADAAQIIGQQIDVMTTTGELTPEQGAEIIQEVAPAIKANQTIPAQVSTEVRAATLPIVVEKTELNTAIGALEAQKEVTDPAFHSVIDSQIAELQEQVKQKDETIKSVLEPETDTKTEVSEQVVTEQIPTSESAENAGSATTIESETQINAIENEKTTQGSEELLISEPIKETPLQGGAPSPTAEGIPVTQSEPVSEEGVEEPEPAKVYVSKTGDYTVSKLDDGSFQVTDKKGKPVSKYRRKETLKEFANNLNLDKGEVADLSGVPENEANRYVAEYSSNPRQILETMASVNEKATVDELDAKERAIADNISRIKADSFAEFSDRNLLEGQDELKRNYISRKAGVDLDTLAQSIEYAAYGDSDGDRITPKDIVDFIFKYPGGARSFYNQKNPVYGSLRDRFIELTGLTPTSEMMDRAVSESMVNDEDVGLEPDKQEVGEMIEPKRKKRRFTKQVMNNSEISGEFKAAIKDDQIYYNELPNKLTIAEANAIISSLGDADAIAAVKDPSNKMNGAVRATIGQILLKKLQSENNYDAALDLLTYLTENATDYGQFNQTFSLFQYLTPEGQMRYAMRENQRQVDQRAKKEERRITRTRQAVRSVVRESINEALQNVGVAKMAVENLDVNEPSEFGSKNKIFTKKRAQDALKSIKGVKFFSTPFDPRLLEVAGYYLEGSALKFTDWAGRMIKKFGNRVIPHLKGIYGELRKELQSEYPSGSFLNDAEIDSNVETVIIEKEGLIKKAIKAELREIGSTIAEIARKHYTEYDDAKSTLTEKLIRNAGLTDANAKKLADAISSEFDKIIATKRNEHLNRMVKEGGVRKKVADALQQELVNTVNLGGFSNVEFMEKWAEANGYPKLTPENLKEIKSLADKVATAREGFQKVRAMEDLLAYQAKIKGINLWDVATAIWYANILSGPYTHLVNAVSTGMNAFFNYMNAAGRATLKGEPSTALNLARAFWQGAQHGWLVGGDVMRQGYNPIKGKLEVPATLEIIAALKKEDEKYLPGGKAFRRPLKGIANALKYVRRAMVAADVVFYEGLREMRSYEYAKSRAQKGVDGILDPTIDQQNSALNMLNKTDADIERFTEQADQEFKNDIRSIENDGLPDKEKRIRQAVRDRNRRLLELMQINRPEQLSEEAVRFAAKGTYNHPPEGVLGAVARSVNMASTGFPALRFLIPFTNIIANVANESLNYTPYGFARAGMGGTMLNKIPGVPESSKVELTEDEKTYMYTKAIMGTLLMSTLYLASQPGDDEEEPLIEITANGYGSMQYQKNDVLKKVGWQPYSFRVNFPNGESTPWISYQQLPMLLGMAYIGNIRDAQKYRKEKITDDALTQWAIAGTSTSRTLLDMTFISSLNTLLNTAMNPQDENAADNFMRTFSTTTKSFVVPNAWNQSFRQMQEVFDIPSKQVRGKFLAPYLKEIPVARNMYFDQINALGEPVIPDNDKFWSEEKGTEMWQLIVDKGMMNLNVPSQKTLSLPDPKKIEALEKDGKKLKVYKIDVQDLETGKRMPLAESVITDEEFYNFCKYRGEYIRNELQKVMDSKNTKILDSDWMTKTEKEASKKAMVAIANDREQNSPSP